MKKDSPFLAVFRFSMHSTQEAQLCAFDECLVQSTPRVQTCNHGGIATRTHSVTGTEPGSLATLMMEEQTPESPVQAKQPWVSVWTCLQPHQQGESCRSCVRFPFLGLLICKMGPKEEVTHSVYGAPAVCTILLAEESVVKKTGSSPSLHFSALSPKDN